MGSVVIMSLILLFSAFFSPLDSPATTTEERVDTPIGNDDN